VKSCSELQIKAGDVGMCETVLGFFKKYFVASCCSSLFKSPDVSRFKRRDHGEIEGIGGGGRAFEYTERRK